MTVAAALLAAGRSSRFAGGAKLRARFAGRLLYEWALQAALDAGLDGTYVVTGATELSLPDGVTAVPNPEWSRGQATSLAAAVEAVRRDGHRALVVALADQPLLEPSAWRAVAETTAPIAVATYAGRRGHPVRLERSVWPLLPEEGEAAARVVMAEHPDLVVEVPCRGDPSDVDTVADLRRLEGSSVGRATPRVAAVGPERSRSTERSEEPGRPERPGGP